MVNNTTLWESLPYTTHYEKSNHINVTCSQHYSQLHYCTSMPTWHKQYVLMCSQKSVWPVRTRWCGQEDNVDSIWKSDVFKPTVSVMGLWALMERVIIVWSVTLLRNYLFSHFLNDIIQRPNTKGDWRNNEGWIQWRLHMLLTVAWYAIRVFWSKLFLENPRPLAFGKKYLNESESHEYKDKDKLREVKTSDWLIDWYGPKQQMSNILQYKEHSADHLK